jgi:threonine synthase
LRYVSTRGEAPDLEFEDVLLTGLARDGGLYVPAAWPSFTAADFEEFATLDYATLAVRVMAPFVGTAMPPDQFTALVQETYAGFDHPDTAPLREIGDGEWLLELFHGPTLAFKDFALQLLGRMFDHALARRGERRTIVVATSGDTGSAAIEAFKDRENLDIIVLHPAGRVSEVQRRQMTTVLSDNVRNLAIEGSFDDCQALVKALFNDLEYRDEMGLAAVNSINWARVMAQTVYYVKAAVALGAPGRQIAFSVPTGNFGDVYAGYVARAAGLPISQLVVATNRNDILARVLSTGEYKVGDVEPTMSPSMDIQVASNFERLLFEILDRDGGAVQGLMSQLQSRGAFSLDLSALQRAGQVFDARRVDEDETLATIASVYKTAGVLIDPHTAVGLAAGRGCRRDESIPMVTLATAHPAKFPSAIATATGVPPDLPPALADLHQRPERCDEVAGNIDALKTYIRDNANR